MAIVGVVVVLLLAAGGALLVARNHGGGGGPAPSATPVPLLVQFDAKKMICPPTATFVAGDTCDLGLTLEGNVRITVTWDSPAFIGIGLRDIKGKDVGPQITGEKGHAEFVAGDLAKGMYDLRVVNVTHAKGPIHLTILAESGLSAPAPTASAIPPQTPPPHATVSPARSAAPSATG